MNRLICNKQLAFFEENTRSGEVHELHPICCNEYWEVYASFSAEGIRYAIVGVNGERCVYKEYGGLSREIIYYEPAGRDLMCHYVASGAWRLLSVRGDKLCDITAKLANCGNPMKLFVTYMEFKSQVLWLHARASRYYEEDFYFKQTENGYEKIDEAEAKVLFD